MATRRELCCRRKSIPSCKHGFLGGTVGTSGHGSRWNNEWFGVVDGLGERQRNIFKFDFFGRVDFEKEKPRNQRPGQVLGSSVEHYGWGFKTNGERQWR